MNLLFVFFRLALRISKITVLFNMYNIITHKTYKPTAAPLAVRNRKPRTSMSLSFQSRGLKVGGYQYRWLPGLISRLEGRARKGD